MAPKYEEDLVDVNEKLMNVLSSVNNNYAELVNTTWAAHLFHDGIKVDLEEFQAKTNDRFTKAKQDIERVAATIEATKEAKKAKETRKKAEGHEYADKIIEDKFIADKIIAEKAAAEKAATGKAAANKAARSSRQEDEIALRQHDDKNLRRVKAEQAEYVPKKQKLVDFSKTPDRFICIMINEDDDTNLIKVLNSVGLLKSSKLLRRLFQAPDDISVYDPAITKKPRIDLAEEHRYIFFDKLISMHKKPASGGIHILKDPTKKQRILSPERLWPSMESFIIWLNGGKIKGISNESQRTMALQLADYLEVTADCGYRADLAKHRLL
ncbi:hypothetical protein PVAG01_09919 [Phlyctema vagabunda]|uniref:Uncharacterized protein n=1 Tax=Phlyctema vagabunda TaxID=108571 RepID=A0ABR4P4H1_9HELO